MYSQATPLVHCRKDRVTSMPTKYDTPSVPLDPFLELNSLCHFLEDYVDTSRGNELSDEDLASFKQAIGDFFYSPVYADYLANTASHDILSNIDFEQIYEVHHMKGRAHAYKVKDNVQAASNALIDAIINKVNNGNTVLISLLARYRFGFTDLHLKHDPGVIFNRMAEQAKSNEGLLLGHMTLHTLLSQGIPTILQANGYTQKSVEFLSKHISQKDMLKFGGPSVKRHLISNDLNL